ncbi:TerB family tellurite resistance protein [Mucilaginibacter sp. R-33]|uniref:TerB family tellurite resistance protein n=1 Tax=Mucilaginibacter sp. R-33 TaxID=3416711 RepID=UPI003CEE15E1
MKKMIAIGSMILVLTVSAPGNSRAQSVADCVQQLVLDYQKLASLKDILGQMYSGYSVLSKGYSAVKSVARGNFSLHEVFLDGLYLVSPAVRKYPRVTDIISDQAQLVREYKAAAAGFNQNAGFSPDELAYIMKIYNNLAGQSLKNLDALAMVVTDSQLRMSDAERLTAIYRLFLESRNQLSYLRKFTDQAKRIALQRTRETNERQALKKINGLL